MAPGQISCFVDRVYQPSVNEVYQSINQSAVCWHIFSYSGRTCAIHSSVTIPNAQAARIEWF